MKLVIEFSFVNRFKWGYFIELDIFLGSYDLASVINPEGVG